MFLKMKSILAGFATLSVAVLLIGCGGQKDYHFKEGDLFFQDQDCGDYCDAIEAVTSGYEGANRSHVGVLIRHNDSWKILEAGGEGVVLTAVDTFLNRSHDDKGNPKVIVGRVEGLDTNLLSIAKRIGLQMIGRPYDEFFNIHNEALYCSELIYESFRNTRGEPIFELFPMTFKDPNTEETFPIWEEYFSDLGIPIPEGQPGLNPGSMSTSESVDIVYHFGEPNGFRDF